MSNEMWMFLIIVGSLFVANFINARIEARLDKQFKLGYQRGLNDGRRVGSIRR